MRLLNCNDVQIASTTTNATGGYRFDGLPVGNYRLRFIAPAGYRFTTPGVGSGGKNSNADPATGLTACLSLAAGQTRLGIDAGLVTDNTQPFNVLFIAIDDLRPEIGAYGVNAIRTPNLDALAREGTIFTRAYAQMSLCSPSRTSLMTGLRPDTAGVTDLVTHFRSTVPGIVTLPQYFKNRGYRAEGFCKIYHDSLNDAQSWSVPHDERLGPHPAGGAGWQAICRMRRSTSPTRSSPTTNARPPQSMRFAAPPGRTNRSLSPSASASRTCRSSRHRPITRCTTRMPFPWQAIRSRPSMRRLLLSKTGVNC